MPRSRLRSSLRTRRSSSTRRRRSVNSRRTTWRKDAKAASGMRRAFETQCLGSSRHSMRSDDGCKIGPKPAGTACPGGSVTLGLVSSAAANTTCRSARRDRQGTTLPPADVPARHRTKRPRGRSGCFAPAQAPSRRRSPRPLTAAARAGRRAARARLPARRRRRPSARRAAGRAAVARTHAAVRARRGRRPRRRSSAPPPCAHG